MRARKFCIVAILLVLCSKAKALQPPLIWKISGRTSHFYLGGTVHLLPKNTIPDEYFRIADVADEIIFERLGENAIDCMAYFRSKGTALPETLLNSNQVLLARNFGDKYNIPLPMQDNLRIDEFVDAVREHNRKAAGLGTGISVEEYVVLHRIGKGQHYSDLETGAEHCDDDLKALDAVRPELDSMLNDKDQPNKVNYLVQLIKSWETRDASASLKYTKKLMTRAEYKYILVNRSIRWVPKLDAYAKLNDGKVRFVLVGKAHLPGDKGLLSMLRAKGYKVERIKSFKVKTPTAASPAQQAAATAQ